MCVLTKSSLLVFWQKIKSLAINCTTTIIIIIINKIIISVTDWPDSSLTYEVEQQIFLLPATKNFALNLIAIQSVL